MAEIYLAGGCFWGLEEYFSRISGVLATSVGYANGQVETTNYQLLKETDHAETVQVIYDENTVSLREILLYYFRVIDPLSINQQGNDRGRQYRTGIYYQDEADLPPSTQWCRSRSACLVERLQWKWRDFATTFWLRTTTKTILRKILLVTVISM